MRVTAAALAWRPLFLCGPVCDANVFSECFADGGLGAFGERHLANGTAFFSIAFSQVWPNWG